MNGYTCNCGLCNPVLDKDTAEFRRLDALLSGRLRALENGALIRKTRRNVSRGTNGERPPSRIADWTI